MDWSVTVFLMSSRIFTILIPSFSLIASDVMSSMVMCYLMWTLRYGQYCTITMPGVLFSWTLTLYIWCELFTNFITLIYCLVIFFFHQYIYCKCINTSTVTEEIISTCVYVVTDCWLANFLNLFSFLYLSLMKWFQIDKFQHLNCNLNFMMMTSSEKSMLQRFRNLYFINTIATCNEKNSCLYYCKHLQQCWCKQWNAM